MKVGSLVICPKGHNSYREGCPALPASDDITYTIRDIVSDPVDGDICLRFDEIICPLNPYGNEFSYSADKFREIQPPIDLTELLEETKVKELQEA